MTPVRCTTTVGSRAEAEQAQARLLRVVGRYPDLVVAFSAGADSALLVAAAARALPPERVLAVTASSDSLATGELAQAEQFCAQQGVRHLVSTTHEMQRDGYRRNGPDRCYFCKDELVQELRRIADERGMTTVATGTNADDLVAGHRPGLAAAARHGAVTPLAEAGLTKSLVREVSRLWALPTWAKPQAACLSSRIAYGIEITPARLSRVDRAERGLRAALAEAGLRVQNLRVRDLGDAARVEVDAELVAAAQACPTTMPAVLAAGFQTAWFDPRGFRSGAMNEGLRPG